MGSSHTLDQLDICFDDTHAIANAGLLLPATLAERLGTQQAADQLIDLGEQPGAAHPGAKHYPQVLSSPPRRPALPPHRQSLLTGTGQPRFEAGRPNELWTGNALHGPRIGGRKTYLFASSTTTPARSWPPLGPGRGHRAAGRRAAAGAGSPRRARV
jgi:hypothetical protein